MKCLVTYAVWEEMDIPDEILQTHDEEAIMREVFNKRPACEMVREVYGLENKITYVKRAF